MWREIRIFAHRQSIKQTKSNSKTEATFYPLWSVDTRVAGQKSDFKMGNIDNIVHLLFLINKALYSVVQYNRIIQHEIL